MLAVDQVSSGYAYRSTGFNWNHVSTAAGYVIVWTCIYEYFTSAPIHQITVTYGGNAPVSTSNPTYIGSYPGLVAKIESWLFTAVVGTASIAVTMSGNPLYQVKCQAAGVKNLTGSTLGGAVDTGIGAILGGGTLIDSRTGTTEILDIVAIFGGATANNGYSAISTSQTVLLSNITDTCPSASGFAYTPNYNSPGQFGSALLSNHSTSSGPTFTYGLTVNGSNGQSANGAWASFYIPGPTGSAFEPLPIFPPYCVRSM